MLLVRFYSFILSMKSRYYDLDNFSLKLNLDIRLLKKNLYQRTVLRNWISWIGLSVHRSITSVMLQTNIFK